MSNTLDYVINHKSLISTKELSQLLLEKGEKIADSTLYGMARGEKPIPQKLQEIFADILGIRKLFWGKELIPPSFETFEALDEENPTEFNELEKELIKFAMSSLIPDTYNRPVAVQPTSNKAAQRNLKRTIYKSVPLTTLLPYVRSVKKKEYLTKLDAGNGFYVWGVQPGVYNQWTKLDRGSYVLFSAFKKFYLWGTVVHTLHSRELAIELWPEDVDEPFEYIYILVDMKEISLEVEEFNQIVGYSANNRIQGFNVLDSIKSGKVIKALDLFSTTIQPKVNRKSFEAEIDRLAKDGSLDVNRNHKGRLEQAFFREHLFGDESVGTCCICHSEIPKQGLIAGHIKKRSECTLSEKKNINICAPYCRFCDIWFELGYISVDHKGEVVCISANNDKKTVTPDLQSYFNNVKGNACLYWNEDTKDFFAWHNTYHHFDGK